MDSIPSVSGMVVCQAQELRSRIRGSALNAGTIPYLRGIARIAGQRGMAGRSLCQAHKERCAQFVSCSGCSDGIVPGNNHDAGIRDYRETP
jgi:hypothetical protein